MARVLVAGSTGYLGRFVVRELKDRGHWVRALARDPEKLARPGPFREPAVRDRVDEVFVGHATRPETLAGICDGVDVVFSSLGKTRQKDRLTPWDVDYGANRNLLERALEAGVPNFVYVGGIHVPGAERLGLYRAHEAFIRALGASGIRHAVLRPTGFFSDLSEYLQMAQAGRAYVIGAGTGRMNPIHGADLAAVCADALEGSSREILVGGPVTYTWQEIAELAFAACRRVPKITHVPPGLVRAGARVLHPFRPAVADLLEFMTLTSGQDLLASPAGTRTLAEYFREMISG